MMAEGFVSTRRTRQSRQREEARITSQRLASSGALASAQHTLEQDAAFSSVSRSKVSARVVKHSTLWRLARQVQAPARLVGQAPPGLRCLGQRPA